MVLTKVVWTACSCKLGAWDFGLISNRAGISDITMRDELACQPHRLKNLARDFDGFARRKSIPFIQALHLNKNVVASNRPMLEGAAKRIAGSVTNLTRNPLEI